MATTMQIYLTNPQVAYTAGSIIKGKVVVQLATDEAIGVVAITFSGRGKTKLIRHNGQNRRVYRGRAPLFRFRKTLYSSHFTLKADRYSWDFEFTFPSHSDPSCIEDAFDATGVWRATGEVHPLPPSFSHYENNSRNQGMVEYKLEAEMIRANPKIFETKTSSELEVMYLPPAPIPTPGYGLYSRDDRFQSKTLLLLPDKTQLTAKEKMRSFFKPSELPTATFVLRLIYPTITFPDRPLPIRLAVVFMATSEDVVATPVVTLSALSIKIKSNFNFRSSGFFECQGQIEQEHQYCDFKNTKITIPQTPKSDNLNRILLPVPVAELPAEGTYLDLAKLLRRGINTPAVCPSFRTVNVAVSHRLKVKFQVTCASKTFSFELSDSLMVVSPTPERRVESPPTTVHAVASSSADIQPPSEDTFELPVYSRTAEPGTAVLESSAAETSNPPSYVQGKEQPQSSVKAN